MSLSFYVINGKIPAVTLKNTLLKNGISGSTYLPNKDRKLIGIKYDKTGVWWGYIDKNGNVIEFTEYAGGHGNDTAENRLISQLEKKFKCEITMDIDELNAYVVKTTGKSLPKDPFAGCGTIEYSKKYPKGKCMDAPVNRPQSVFREVFGRK